MTTCDTECPTRHEDGFGMIEIVVSMFLLALLALSLLPLLVQGIRASAANATLATATQLVHDRMEQARTHTTCTGLAALNGTVTTPGSDDSLGVSFNIVTEVDTSSCPVAGPDVIKVTVGVTPAAVVTPPHLSEATTLVLVMPEIP